MTQKTAKTAQESALKPQELVLTPEDFKHWRRRLGLSQQQASTALGLKPRMIQYYEKGERNGKKIALPKTIRLACQALSMGIIDYDGENVVLVPEGKTLIWAIDALIAGANPLELSQMSLAPAKGAPT